MIANVTLLMTIYSTNISCLCHITHWLKNLLMMKSTELENISSLSPVLYKAMIRHLATSQV